MRRIALLGAWKTVVTFFCSTFSQRKFGLKPCPL